MNEVGSSAATAGKALQGAGTLVQGVANLKAGKQNVANLRAEARSSIAQGVADEADIRARARATAGEAIAAMGANGGGLGTGSALDLLREVELESGLDQLRLRRGAANKAAALRKQANQERTAATVGAFATVIKVAGDALSGGTGGGG